MDDLRQYSRAAADRHAMACTTCGTVGRPITETPGSFAIEIVLWLAMILPGMIYTVWRLSRRRRVCKACRSAQIVPLNTPAGRRVLGAREPPQ